MHDRNETGRQSGWPILVAATAVALSGGVAVVDAASTTSPRVTLDDVVPMHELAEPSPIVLRDDAIVAAPAPRHDSPLEFVVRQAGRIDVTDVATQGGVGSVDPTPNTPDPTPNTPDPTPDTPDPTPNSPDSASPDPTPNTPDVSPESPD